MNSQQINQLLTPNNLFAGRIHVLEQADSTNTRLKLLADEGAVEGTVLLAEEQTAGRGTQGRSFHSPRGEGLYLSLLLRPQTSVDELLTLTGRVAVAVMDGIRAATGAPVSIKWLNDIWLNGRKLCGILTELSLPGRDGLPHYAVVGVGVNVRQTAEGFRTQGLDAIATSLAVEGYPVSRHRLAAAILNEVDRLYRTFPAGRSDALVRYCTHCLTVGRQVSFRWEGRTVTAQAVGIDQDFSLITEDGCGVRRTVSFGTVTLL